MPSCAAADPAQAKRMVLGHRPLRLPRQQRGRSARHVAGRQRRCLGRGRVSGVRPRSRAPCAFPATHRLRRRSRRRAGPGGRAHLAKLAKDEGWDLEAVLNNDIVGGNTTPGDKLQLKDRVRVFSEGVPSAATPEQARRIRAIGGENDSPSRQLARAMEDIGANLFSELRPCALSDAWIINRPDRYLRGGDHSSFNHEGFAAVRLTEWREDYNHQHQNVVRPPAGSNEPVLGDLIEFVDFSYVAKVARLNAAALPPWRVLPASPARSPSITPSWTTARPSTGIPPPAKSTHYELLWRDTIAFDWQYAAVHPSCCRRRTPFTSPCPCPKTTSSSACARSTPPVTAAWWSYRRPGAT